MKKLLLAFISIFFTTNSFALPGNSYKKEEAWAKNHPFLVYENCHCAASHYKKLNGNRFLTYNYEGADIIDENTIMLLGNGCQDSFGSPIELDDMTPNVVECLEKTKEEFKDNKSEGLLKILTLIYNNKELLEDIKNAKLYKSGYRYFYINSGLGSNPDGTPLVVKRNKFKKPIEEKIYSGKKFDYLISYYKISILGKNAKRYDNKNFIGYVTDSWKSDLLLKNKLESEVKQKEVVEEKKKVFNLD